MKTYEITHIQIFDFAVPILTTVEGDWDMQYSYSANVIINDSFVVQISGDHNQATFDGITDSDTCFWNDCVAQDRAYVDISSSDLEAVLEESGFENNIGWLEDNASEIMNPENVQYRFDNTETGK